MTLLSIIQAVAKNTGIEPPSVVISNPDANAVKLLEFANETGQELARRVDWTGLRRSRTIEGTGFAALFDLPDDYARMVEGWAITHSGNPVRGGLTADEWNALAPVAGSPRYFQTVQRKIGFYPFPPEGDQITVNYLSLNWTSTGNAAFTADTDSTVFPEQLVEMGTTWRHKRHIAADYSDYLAEYDAALADFARFDGGERLP